MDQADFYVGGFAQPGEAGIRACALDPQTGACQVTAEVATLRNPAYLLCHPRRAVLYAVEEIEPEGRVVALSTGEGSWRQLCSVPSGGAGPCHLALSPDARYLFVSHYAGGCLTVFELDEDGWPVKMCDHLRHERIGAAPEGTNPVRQERAHVHFTLCDGERVFVSDLGLNQVFVYRFDAVRGKLRDCGERIDFPGGAGPRHLALSDDGQHLYVLCELNAQVHVFGRTEDGGWRRVQVESTVPEDFTRFADFTYSIGAAIRIVNGRWLYTSTRGHNSIAVFRMTEDGRLSERRIFPSEGETPRDFHVVRDCLIVANQDGGCLSVFRRDEETGGHALIHQAFGMGQPSCVCVKPRA